MTKTRKLSEVSQEVEKLYAEEERLLLSSKEWLAFIKSYNGFRRVAYKASLPFDPRFNAVHWGFGINGLCREIAFGYCWMNAYATYYKSQTPPSAQPANVQFHVSYFADNSITRIDSCRDKIALMVWAFYCPFNPENRPNAGLCQCIGSFEAPVTFRTISEKLSRLSRPSGDASWARLRPHGEVPPSQDSPHGTKDRDLRGQASPWLGLHVPTL